MSDSLKRNIARGLVWSLSGQFGYLFISLLANVILARLLSPSEFGQMGIVLVFITVAMVLSESGMAGALIRKESVSDMDYSTVFVFNLIISIAMFGLIMLGAGTVARFYEDSLLAPILSVTSIVVLLNAFQIVPNSKMERALAYKKKYGYRVLSVGVAAIVSVIMAFQGMGVWSIVAMQVINSFLLSVFYMIVAKGGLSLSFNWTSFKGVYKFGVNTTFASLISSFFDNIYQLILGKYFSIVQTGFFYQAKKLQEVPIGVLKSTTLGLVFSSLSRLQGDKEKFYSYYRKMFILFTIGVGFVCMFMFWFSETIIYYVLGEKWMGAVFFMRVLIASSFFYMQEMFNRVVFKVFDRTGQILWLEVVKKSVQAVTIVVGVVMRDMNLLLYGFLLTSVMGYVVNHFACKKVLDLIGWSENKVLLKVLVVIGLSFAILVCLDFVVGTQNGIVSILLKAAVLCSAYLLLVFALLKFNALDEVKNILKLVRNKKI